MGSSYLLRLAVLSSGFWQRFHVEPTPGFEYRLQEPGTVSEQHYISGCPESSDYLYYLLPYKIFIRFSYTFPFP